MRVGEPMLVNGWNISVVQGRIGPAADAAEGSAAGYDVSVKALNWGDATTTLASDVALSALGRSGRIYRTASGCVEGLAVNREVNPDGVVEGFVCFVVDAADADGLILVVEAIASPVPHRVYLATIPPGDLELGGFGPEELVAALQATGVEASARPSPYGRTTGYMNRSAHERILCLDGQEANLFIYDTDQLREMDTATLRPDGNPENTAIDLYYGTLMWWAKGRVIVNYNFADPHIADSLTEAMGASVTPDGDSFAEPPVPLPDSEVCTTQ